MKSYRLGDVIRIKHGYAFSGEGISTDDNGCVLVTPGNFKIGGGFQEEKCKFFEGEYPEEYVLKSGDHIVTMTDLSKTIDTLGYSAIVPANKKRIYLHNQRIGLITYINDELDPLYINYLMRSRSYQVSIANTSTGSTVHHTSPDKIYDYIFEAPDLELQKQIAGILSAYDTLIENNRKQIKLLEEAARRLYKEWFVDLRFPGHEHTPIVNGIPEGWRKTNIGEVCETVGGGTPSTKFEEYYSHGTIPWVTPTDITRNDCLFLLRPEKYITEEGLNKSSAKLVPPYTILMTSRASVGFFGLSRETVCTNQGFISCIPHDKAIHYYMLYNLMDRVDEIRAAAGGSTYLEIRKSDFRKFVFIVPSSHVLECFNQIVRSILKKMENLKHGIDHLTEARDRLLPKLMSGEIAIK